MLMLEGGFIIQIDNRVQDTIDTTDNCYLAIISAVGRCTLTGSHERILIIRKMSE